MPAGTVVQGSDVVKKICVTITPARPYESPSLNDLLESLRVLIDYIIAQNKGKCKHKSRRKSDRCAGIIVLKIPSYSSYDFPK